MPYRHLAVLGMALTLHCWQNVNIFHENQHTLNTKMPITRKLFLITLIMKCTVIVLDILANNLKKGKCMTHYLGYVTYPKYLNISRKISRCLGSYMY